MNEVKTVRKGDLTLKHEWYLDDFGFKRNSIVVFNEKTRTNYPIMPPIKVNYDTRDGVFAGDDTTPYTDKEYEKMFEEV